MTPESPEDTNMNDARIVVTVLALCLFVAFTGFLVIKVDSPDLNWTRYVFLYNGVSAIVFAAVGWLFGREVYRGQAQSAERRARNEEARATTAQESAAQARVAASAERERALGFAHAVRSATASTEARPPAGLQQMGSQAPPQAQIAALADLAKRLYPDVK
jgi:hypothetical protein